MTLIGYARVSSKEQNLDRQLEALKQAGTAKIFKESVSGKSIEDRPGFNEMMNFLREGDTLVIHSLDRLSRNYDDIKQIVQQLVVKGVKLHSVNEEFINIDTGNEDMNKFLTDTIIGLLAFVADNERKKIRERQREGIELAKQRGVYQGRPETYTEEHKGLNRAVELFNNRDTNKMTVDDIVEVTGVSRATIYRKAKEFNESN